VTSHSVVLEAPPINATLFQTALALTARTYDSHAGCIAHTHNV
jgi:hypothetical protein